MQVAEYLRKMPLFASLTEAELLDVLRIARVVRFKAGDALCRTGEPGTSLFVLDRGVVSVSVRGAGGVPMEVRRMGAGEILGELALVDSQPRSADVIALEDVQAYALDRAEFDKLRAQLNPAAFKILRHVALIVASRLRDLNEYATTGIASAPSVPARDGKGAAQPAGWQKWLSGLRRRPS